MLATVVCLFALAGIQPAAAEPVTLTPEQRQAAWDQCYLAHQVVLRFYDWYVNRFYPNAYMQMLRTLSSRKVLPDDDWCLYLPTVTMCELPKLALHLRPDVPVWAYSTLRVREHTETSLTEKLP
jgi:hypothetical protein